MWQQWKQDLFSGLGRNIELVVRSGSGLVEDISGVVWVRLRVACWGTWVRSGVLSGVVARGVWAGVCASPLSRSGFVAEARRAHANGFAKGCGIVWSAGP